MQLEVKNDAIEKAHKIISKFSDENQKYKNQISCLETERESIKSSEKAILKENMEMKKKI